MKRSLVAAGFVALMSSSVFAAGAVKFDELDKDKSGTISTEEAMKDAAVMSQFKTLDADSDGQLTKTEFADTSKKDTKGAAEPAKEGKADDKKGL